MDPQKHHFKHPTINNGELFVGDWKIDNCSSCSCKKVIDIRLVQYARQHPSSFKKPHTRAYNIVVTLDLILLLTHINAY